METIEIAGRKFKKESLKALSDDTLKEMIEIGEMGLKNGWKDVGGKVTQALKVLKEELQSR